MRRLLSRSTPVLLPLSLLAACGGDGTGPDPLPTASVDGVYQICSLSFTAGNLLPTADVLAGAAERNPAPPLSFPNLKLNPETDRKYELEYVPRGASVPVRLTGTYRTDDQGVTIDFNDADARTARTALLLPDPLRLQFEATPRRQLTASALASTVARADYARLAGLTPEDSKNLNDPISGTLDVRLAQKGCD